MQKKECKERDVDMIVAFTLLEEEIICMAAETGGHWSKAPLFWIRMKSILFYFLHLFSKAFLTENAENAGKSAGIDVLELLKFQFKISIKFH